MSLLKPRKPKFQVVALLDDEEAEMFEQAAISLETRNVSETLRKIIRAFAKYQDES